MANMGDDMVKATEPTRGPMFPWFSKKGSSTDTGKLPAKWEEANRKSEEQALASEKTVGKKKVQKATKKRSGVLANKRTPRKKY